MEKDVNFNDSNRDFGIVEDYINGKVDNSGESKGIKAKMN